jgi:two-component system, NtrC family, response regulator AtoC
LDLYFTEKGHTVYTASSGREGLDSFSRHIPDLVILDLRSPDRNGLSIFENLRKEEEHAKVIMVATIYDTASANRARIGGVCAYIHKPIDIEKLDLAVNEALALPGQGTMFLRPQPETYRTHHVEGSPSS